MSHIFMSGFDDTTEQAEKKEREKKEKEKEEKKQLLARISKNSNLVCEYLSKFELLSEDS